MAGKSFSVGTMPFRLAPRRLIWPAGRSHFFAIGLPGLALAVWVRTLREPVRGAMDGVPTAVEAHPFREFGRELSAVLPLLSLLHLLQFKASAKMLGANLVAFTALSVGAWGLTDVAGNGAQWAAVALGFYATFCWGQSLLLRDPPTAVLILKSRSWGVVLYSAYRCSRFQCTD